MHLPIPPPAFWPLFWNIALVAFGPLRWRVTLIRPAPLMMMIMMMVIGLGIITIPTLYDGVPKTYQ